MDRITTVVTKIPTPASVFTREWYKRVSSETDKLIKSHKKKKLPYKDLQREKQLLDSLNISRSSRVQELAKLIGSVELLIFGSISFYGVYKPDSASEYARRLLPILAGWIAIKVIGNYSQWSGHILGRATYYIFLLGTLINIGWGLILGAIVAELVKLT